MNKMLVAVFDNETAADAGLQALRKLHRSGDITLYASGLIAKDAKGKHSVKKAMDAGPDQGSGTAVSSAVGSLIGLLSGPVGVAVDALTGSLEGAVRDFWTAGVGLDFVEEAASCSVTFKKLSTPQLDICARASRSPFVFAAA